MTGPTERHYGLLDLPAPILDLVDQGLQWLGLPALTRVLLYGIASGWLSMALYRRWSRQSELTDLGSAARALRRELANYDGPFDGLVERIGALLRLNSRHLRLSFIPALLAGLPLLLILPWLSNQFSLTWPTTGSAVQICADGLIANQPLPRWSDDEARWDASTQCWALPWPDAAAPVGLTWENQTLHSLPGAHPATIVHPRQPLFNALIANPAGYLSDAAPLNALQIDMPQLDLHAWGPSWLRGWLFCYFGSMFATALFFRWRWKLA